MSTDVVNHQALKDLIREMLQEMLREMHPVEPFVNCEEAAQHIGAELNTLRSWAATGYKGIPVYRFGKLVRFKLSELEEWSKRKVA